MSKVISLYNKLLLIWEVNSFSLLMVILLLIKQEYMRFFQEMNIYFISILQVGKKFLFNIHYSRICYA